MTRKLSDADQQQLAELEQRLMTTIEFIAATEEFTAAGFLREAIERAVQKGSLRDMRLLAKEIDAVTATLAPDRRDGLDTVLQNKLGIDREEERQRRRARMESILARGALQSEKERQWVESFRDELVATERYDSLIPRIETLLSR